MTDSAGVNDVAVFRIYQDAGDVLGILQAHIGPVVATIDGLVNTISDRDAVTYPRLARAHPNNFWVGGINRDRANRLHVGLVENGLERRAAIHRLPYATAGRTCEDS